MKVPKHIQHKLSIILEMESRKQKLINEVYAWIESKGIDVQGDEFADAIRVRICNAEFRSVDEFVRDINDFKNGEQVGYG